MHGLNGARRVDGEAFVSREITRAVAAIKLGSQQKLYLGNLDARRDCGHARDYVEGMWLIVRQPDPDDYVLATGKTRSVRDFVQKALSLMGVKIVWRGSGTDEKGIDAQSGRTLVKVDPRYFPPTGSPFWSVIRQKRAKSWAGVTRIV